MVLRILKSLQKQWIYLTLHNAKAYTFLFLLDMTKCLDDLYYIIHLKFNKIYCGKLYIFLLSRFFHKKKFIPWLKAKLFMYVLMILLRKTEKKYRFLRFDYWLQSNFSIGNCTQNLFVFNEKISVHVICIFTIKPIFF